MNEPCHHEWLLASSSAGPLTLVLMTSLRVGRLTGGGGTSLDAGSTYSNNSNS